MPLVHAVDHGGVDFHAAGLPGLVLGDRPFGIQRSRIPSRVHDAQLLEPCESGTTHGGVACIVSTAVLGDVLLLGVHRPVGSRVGDVQEKWLLATLLAVFAQKTNRVVGDGIGKVEDFGLVLSIGVA